MSRAEAEISATPPGAGRFSDYLWPNPFNFDVASAGINRTDATNAQITGPAFVAGAGGIASTVAVDGGVVCVSINTSAVVADGSGVVLSNKRIPIITTKNAGGNPNANDMTCWRLIWNVAAVAPPAAIGEMTLACLANVGGGQANNWIQTASTGFGFQFLNNGDVNFHIEPGVHVTLLKSAAAGFDVTKFHAYEMRLTSATLTADATLAVLIDNANITIPVTFASWAAGTFLPGIQAIGGSPGFAPTLGNSSKFANSLHVHQFRSIAGPTPASLL